MSEAQVESQAPVVHDHDTLAEDDRTNLRAIVIWFVGIVLAVIVAVIYVHNYFGIEMRKELTDKVLTADNPVLRDLRATEHAKLNKYQWIDKKAGTVRIPLDRAQELTLRDWSSRAKAAPAEGASDAVGTDDAVTAPVEGAPAGTSPSEKIDPKAADDTEGAK